MPLCSSLKGFAMRKHIRTSLTLLIVALAAASFMLVLPGCAGGSNDSPGKPDAVGNRSADGASETTQGDVVSTAMVAYANGDQVLFVDQETVSYTHLQSHSAKKPLQRREGAGGKIS